MKGRYYPLWALATASLLFALPVAAKANCTTGGWSSVTGNVSAIGVDTPSVGVKYEGDCGLTVNAGAAPGFVTTTAPAAEEAFSVRFYVFAGGLNLSSGDAVLFEARDGGATNLRLSLRESGGSLELVTAYRSGGSIVEHGTTVPFNNVWHAVALSWARGAGDGNLEVSVDGRERLSQGSIQSGSQVINEIDLGILNNASGSGSVVFDAVELRRSPQVPALLEVHELYNVSTRSPVGYGLNDVVAGFVIKGETDKCVVVRGRGPSMDLNVGTLTNPTLTLNRVHDPNPIAFNDDWADHVDAPVVQALGKHPVHVREAAIHTCLSPGSYTAALRGASGTPLGVGIIEVLDQDVSTPHLFNISTRARVDNGDLRVIAGFIIDGTKSKQVLIRGRGPTVDVPNPRLSDPVIHLYRGATYVTTNDNWVDASNASDITATGKGPSHNLEAAMLADLAPGAYTVILQSKNSVPGIGMVEVLDMTGSSVELN